MAKTKNTEVMAEVLPVLPEDAKIPALDLAPVMTEAKDIEITGNYEVIKSSLEARRDEILKMKVSVKDLDTVEKLKKEAMGYRIYIAEYEKRGKSKWFNGPKDIFAGKIATLQGIVADMEAKAQKVLDKLEAERTGKVTQVLNLYKEQFQEKYAISEEGLALIEYKPAYYNKTAREKDSKDDLEAQFIARRDLEKALALGVKTIIALCAGKPLLNQEKYIEDLKGGRELALVMDDIAAEEARLKAAQQVIVPEVVDEVPSGAPGSFAASTPTVESVDCEKVVVGVIGAASSLLSKSDFPGKMKVTRRDITYPDDLGPALTKIFTELAKYGITAKVVEEGSF